MKTNAQLYCHRFLWFQKLSSTASYLTYLFSVLYKINQKMHYFHKPRVFFFHSNIKSVRFSQNFLSWCELLWKHSCHNNFCKEVVDLFIVLWKYLTISFLQDKTQFSDKISILLYLFIYLFIYFAITLVIASATNKKGKSGRVRIPMDLNHAVSWNISL